MRKCWIGTVLRRVIQRDFTKWVEMVAVNTDLKKRQRQDNMRVEEAAHRWTTFLCRR